MPFDGSKFNVVDDLALLRAARRKIAKPGNWAKGDPDTWGDASCITGWVVDAVAATLRIRDFAVIGEEANRLIAEYIAPEVRDGKHTRYDIKVVRFNDRASTTLADVIALFDRAIARARRL